MYKLSTTLSLPIAHCLYRGAYSGLCCGNVYRDKGLKDGVDDRYELGDKVLPILHGHNYKITVEIGAENYLDANGMLLDFKEFKEILHKYFDQYDHSMILTPENPLTKLYKENYKENGIDFERSRVFVWDANPTAEYMSMYWGEELKKLFEEKMNRNDFKIVQIVVEETDKNCAGYEPLYK